MAISAGLVGAISSGFGRLLQGLDGLFTSDEERLQAKGQIMLIQNEVMSSVLEYEKTLIEQKAQIITAEAKGESWLQRSWRPMTMLAFVVAILAYWFGLTPEGVPAEAVDAMFLLVQLGLSGYIVGRSGEKIVKALDLGNKDAKDKK